MLKKVLIEFLSKTNSANLCKDDVSKLDRLMLSTERKLLYREASLESKAHGSQIDSDILWKHIATLHENYRRYAWKRRGLRLDLVAPRTLAEKIEWLKFNDHSSIFVKLSDKLAVRDYVLEMTQAPMLLNRMLIGGGG